MPVLMSCPQGHQWEDVFDDQLSLQDGQGRCPVCGVALEGIPAPLLAEAASQPPTRRTSATANAPFHVSSADISLPEVADLQASPASSPPAPKGDSNGQGTWPMDESEVKSAFKGPELPGYEILTELGRGGMGVVYLARQTALDRFVAVKMVLGSGYAGEARRRRFRLEAQAVARLHHPNIVQIYDVGEHDDHPYFTLEYVDGGSLGERISGKPLPPREAAEIIEVLARAIHCAHERGIIHRDLKPCNVLMARDGTPKITDFGLAKLMDAEDAHTRTGSVLGTPSYMAPEQALGQKTIGPPADIYALGSILYEALTGRPPFRGETSMDLLIQLANDDPAPVSRIRPGMPRDLETICMKCLQKEPRKRYSSALALAEDLRRFLAHEPVQARPASYSERTVKWVKRRPTWAALIACVVVAALGFSAQAGFQAASRARTERQRVENARAELHEVLLGAEMAVKSKEWEGAAQLFASAQAKIESEQALGELTEEARALLEFVGRRLGAHETLQQFEENRDSALFHATLSTGEGSSSDLRAARDKARQALALVGVSLAAEDQWALGDSFTKLEKDEVREKSYELLMVLADAEAQPLPGQSEKEQHRRAAEALRILDRAPLLGLRTKAYHLRRARLLELLGQQDEAKAETARGEKVPAQSALDHYLLGDELYRRGTPAQAQDEFQATIRAQPDHFWARYFLALCYIRAHRPDLAHDSLTMCLNQHGQIVWIYLMRGFACGQLEKYKDAEADFAEALRLLEGQSNDDARYVLYNNRAIVRVGQKDFEGAVSDLRLAIALRPNQYPAYASLAHTLDQLKRPEEAVAQIGEAIKAAEPLVRSQDVDPTTLALLYRTRARFQRERKDDPAALAALADLERAVAVAPAGSLLLAQVHVERGHLLNLSGRLEEAREAYDLAVKARPAHAPAHRGLGEVLFRQKRYSEAVEAFTCYLKNENNPPAAMYQARALARMRLGDPKAALEDFTLAIAREPTNAVLLTQRGQAFLACQIDQHKAALKDFEDAIRWNPNNGPAYSGRARVRLEIGQVAEAISDADKALELGPRNANVVYSAATLYARAAAKSDADGERKTRSDQEVRRRYQDQAITLLGQAMQLLPEDQRTAFWRDTVQRDSAFSAVRATIEFARLRRHYSSGDAAPQTPAATGDSSSVRHPK
jgi:tetratricopeptide (TPR) repeat protein/predicted Ser/Thr protein kinase